MKDFNIEISKQTKAVSQQGFGLILILGTSKAQDYKEYSAIADVNTDFGPESKEYKIASRIFGQSPSPQKIAISSILYGEEGVPNDLVMALNNLVKIHNDWYFLVCTENAEAVITALAAWVDTQTKMYFVTGQSKTMPALNSENTVYMYHDNADAYVAEGLAAIGATNEAGSLTFKFKTVNGVSAANIDLTELEVLHAAGGFSYISKLGVLQTTEGITTTKEYIDVVMGQDWIKSRMEEEAMALELNNKKIPYDNIGISRLAGVVSSVLQRGADQGIILKDESGKSVYTMKILKREEVSTNDIAKRVYNGISWSAQLQGAIHSGTITGTLSY